MTDVFKTLANARSLFASLVERDVREAIYSRPLGPRDLVRDDIEVFGALNTAMAMLVAQSDYCLAKRIFHACYGASMAYEAEHPGSEIHKGAPTFNMGVVCLRSHDFAGAMQFFEIAEQETIKTTGKRDWRNFLNELFEKNFWDTVEAASATYPLPLYKEIWGVRWGKKAAKRNWKRVSGDSKLLFLMNIAQRIRYHQLSKQSNTPVSQCFGQLYWNLCSDLSRLLETEIHRRANIPSPKPYQLANLLMQGFTTVRLGNISAEIVKLHNAKKVNSTKSFNVAFPDLRKNIEDTTLSPLIRVSNALYLLYATRNQVQHHVDRRMLLFRQPDTAQFTADVLLTLCRLDSWTR